MSESVKIHLADYEIEHSLTWDIQHKGLCDKDKKIICIASDLPNRRETLIHEITHAVIYEYLGHEDSIKWNEEKVCQFIERYLDVIINKTNEAIRLLPKEEVKENVNEVV